MKSYSTCTSSIAPIVDAHNTEAIRQRKWLLGESRKGKFHVAGFGYGLTCLADQFDADALVLDFLPGRYGDVDDSGNIFQPVVKRHQDGVLPRDLERPLLPGLLAVENNIDSGVGCEREHGSELEAAFRTDGVPCLLSGKRQGKDPQPRRTITDRAQPARPPDLHAKMGQAKSAREKKERQKGGKERKGKDCKRDGKFTYPASLLFCKAALVNHCSAVARCDPAVSQGSLTSSVPFSLEILHAEEELQWPRACC